MISRSSQRQKVFTGYAEPKERAPKVALFDNFVGSESGTSHGEISESVLLSEGGLQASEVQRYTNAVANIPPTDFLKADDSELPAMVDSFVAQAASGFYRATAENLKLVLDYQPTVKVVSQSQSENPARVVQNMFTLMTKVEGFQEKIAVGLGLTAEDSQAVILDRLMQRSENIYENDESVKKAKGEYLEQASRAYDQGVVHLVAGGNQGQFAEMLGEAGVRSGRSSFRSVLVNDFTTVVGAHDVEGEVASFNSPNGAVEVFGPGVGVEWVDGAISGTSDGTSVATPAMAGRAAREIAKHPDSSPFQVESALLGKDGQRLSFGEVSSVKGGTEAFLGDGNVDTLVLNAMGEGFFTGIDDSQVDQFIQAKGKNIRFGVPGDTEDQFQIVTSRETGQGERTFMLETYMGDGQHHKLSAVHRDGSWQRSEITEELVLNRS